MNMYWIVGQVHEFDESNLAKWSFIGVFDSEDKAAEIARSHENYFIGPTELNKALPEEITEWDGAYYPFHQAQEDQAES